MLCADTDMWSRTSVQSRKSSFPTRNNHDSHRPPISLRLLPLGQQEAARSHFEPDTGAVHSATARQFRFRARQNGSHPQRGMGVVRPLWWRETRPRVECKRLSDRRVDCRSVLESGTLGACVFSVTARCRPRPRRRILPWQRPDLLIASRCALASRGDSRHPP